MSLIDIFERDKTQGHYQYDIHDNRIISLHGWDAVEYVGLLASSCFEAEGSIMYDAENEDGRLLHDMKEYYKYALERDKHSFVYRVEKSFFDLVTDLEQYDEWAEDYPWDEEGDEKYLRAELEALKELLPKLDFEKNNYYVV